MLYINRVYMFLWYIWKHEPPFRIDVTISRGMPEFMGVNSTRSLNSQYFQGCPEAVQNAIAVQIKCFCVCNTAMSKKKNTAMSRRRNALS